jgi:hypothetical protein
MKAYEILTAKSVLVMSAGVLRTECAICCLVTVKVKVKV